MHISGVNQDNLSQNQNDQQKAKKCITFERIGGAVLLVSYRNLWFLVCKYQTLIEDEKFW